MRHGLVLFAASALSVAWAGTATAQTPAGVEGRLVVGAALQGGMFGDDSPRRSSRVGLTIGGQARWRADRRTGLVLDVAFQPFAIRNPHFDERLRVLTLHVAPEIGRRVYVRPGGGVAVHFWSGQAAETAISLAPSVGLATGARFRAGTRAHIQPELAARASMEHPGDPGKKAPSSWRHAASPSISTASPP